MKLDIGSADHPIPGYKSVDLFVLNVDYNDDIRSLPSFANDSIEAIHTAHILEHLKNDDLSLAFQSIFRVLKPGGMWTIEVPDLLWILEDFLHTPEKNRWGWKLQTIFGLQSHEGEFHRTGFSQDRLNQLLLDHHFVRIQSERLYSALYNQGVIQATAFKPK